MFFGYLQRTYQWMSSWSGSAMVELLSKWARALPDAQLRLATEQPEVLQTGLEQFDAIDYATELTDKYRAIERG